MSRSVTYKQAVTSNTKLYSRITVTDDAYLPDGADVTLRATENIYVHKRFKKGVGKSFRAYIDNTGPYIYDAIGNLIADQNEGATISWTPYGKVREVKTKGDSITVSYRYDAAGNRVEKRVATLTKDALLIEELTNYLRDASGNVMAIYKDNVMTEQPIYGSSRLGQYLGGRKEGQQRFGRKNYELTNHLGNVLTVITDNINMSTTDGVYATVVSATDYYPFGLEMKGRTYSNDQYRYGFNGKEKDNSFASGNSYDYGFRIYNPRIARFTSPDPEAHKYPGYSPYSYALNTPVSAVDPDGRLIIFIGGLRLWVGQGDQKGYGYGTKKSIQGIYNQDVSGYWSTDKNSFGRKADISGGFINRINDNNAWYTSGSSFWTSQPQDRIQQGKSKAEEFHAMVQSGQIKLEKDETIKIVSHSQGGAFSVGFAQQLFSYKDAKGKPIYNIEVLYYITPHQPTKSGFENPEGVRGVQYSNRSDAISSDDPFWLPNGGSELGPVKNISEVIYSDVLPNQQWFSKPGLKSTGAAGNRGGHNVTDNDFIFNIPPGEKGYVAPRKDTPKQTGTSNN